MELQHQIYLLVAIFGGICTLLLVLIVILGIFIVNLRKLVKEEQPQRKYENYGFEHDTTGPNIINDDLRSMKSEAIRRPPHKSNLSKPRNDEASRHGQSNGRSVAAPKTDKRRTAPQPNGPGTGPDRKQRQYSESGDTSGRYSDSAFDNEINNMFDIDDYDDDRDSVESGPDPRNYNRSHQGGRTHHGGAPPPPAAMTGGQNNRNRNNNIPPPGMNRGPPGGGGPRSMYPAGNPHEAKTYFNERGMNY